MVEAHVGDHRDVGAKGEEGAVRLVGLDHDPVAVPPGRVGACRARLAADQERGSRPQAASACAAMPAVVVLPCVPATAMRR